MKFTAEIVAEMLMSPLSGMEFIEKSISNEWESSKENLNLSECLNEIVDQYAYFINSEIGWDRARKLQALQGTVTVYLRPKKQSITNGSA